MDAYDDGWVTTNDVDPRTKGWINCPVNLIHGDYKGCGTIVGWHHGTNRNAAAMNPDGGVKFDESNQYSGTAEFSEAQIRESLNAFLGKEPVENSQNRV